MILLQSKIINNDWDYDQNLMFTLLWLTTGGFWTQFCWIIRGFGSKFTFTELWFTLSWGFMFTFTELWFTLGGFMLTLTELWLTFWGGFMFTLTELWLTFWGGFMLTLTELTLTLGGGFTFTFTELVLTLGWTLILLWTIFFGPNPMLMAMSDWLRYLFSCRLMPWLR